eukprot:CAMPEP_0115104996 /NCGR_PEP_ID=MMETSP0227-20121206/35691_1 /TAXON_ID=89957 /ORGANISM="Polarella glacialis, Strain CCMP 1383" /LENGTH=350 /DNA_ID=CAMNT_0002502107 /DNA_START=111 /DNA_END=1159 /DNA_ORIENTATION=-
MPSTEGGSSSSRSSTTASRFGSGDASAGCFSGACRGCFLPLDDVLRGRRVQTVRREAAEAAKCRPEGSPSSQKTPRRRREGLPLPLDVGFAVVQLVENVDEVPRLELRVDAVEAGEISEAGISALLEFLDFALALPLLQLEASSKEGFQLTYNSASLGAAQLDFVRRLVCWCCEPVRQATWQRCKRWKIVVAEDYGLNQVGKLLLYSAFCLYPPPCPTYLLTDAAAPLSVCEGEGPFAPNPDVVFFAPNPETLAIARLQCDLASEVACRKRSGSDAEKLPDEATGVVPSASAEGDGRDLRREVAPKKVWEGKLPDSIEVGFAEVHQGLSRAGVGFLKILGREGDLTDAGL